MMDYRTTEPIPAHLVTELCVVRGDHDGMWRVIATVPGWHPEHRVVWEPSLLHLATDNTHDQALRALARLEGTRQ